MFNVKHIKLQSITLFKKEQKENKYATSLNNQKQKQKNTANKKRAVIQQINKNKKLEQKTK